MFCNLLIFSVCCGERGIRTPGAFQLNSFQDCRNRPLYHLSKLILSNSETAFVPNWIAKVVIILKPARLFTKKWQKKWYFTSIMQTKHIKSGFCNMSWHQYRRTPHNINVHYLHWHEQNFTSRTQVYQEQLQKNSPETISRPLRTKTIMIINIYVTIKCIETIA